MLESNFASGFWFSFNRRWIAGGWFCRMLGAGCCRMPMPDADDGRVAMKDSSLCEGMVSNVGCGMLMQKMWL
jgi:hypothetical protein